MGEYNSTQACSWFTSNPIHCLRSRHIHGHSPPCVPYVNGKPHLINRSQEGNAFFDGSRLKTAAIEEHALEDDSSLLLRDMKDGASGLTGNKSGGFCGDGRESSS